MLSTWKELSSDCWTTFTPASWGHSVSAVCNLSPLRFANPLPFSQQAPAAQWTRWPRFASSRRAWPNCISNWLPPRRIRWSTATSSTPTRRRRTCCSWCSAWNSYPSPSSSCRRATRVSEIWPSRRPGIIACSGSEHTYGETRNAKVELDWDFTQDYRLFDGAGSWDTV